MIESLKVEAENFQLNQMDHANLVAFLNSPVLETMQKVMGGAKKVWTAKLVVERDMDAMRILQGQIAAANYLLNIPHIIVEAQLKAAKKEASVNQSEASARKPRNKA